MRIRDLCINDFRGLGRFEMKNLGRINLIVGENNSGKTTILEAVNILMAYGNAIPLWSVLSRRGEVVWDGGTREWQADARRLFLGHHIPIGASFLLSAAGGENEIELIAEIQEDELDQSSLGSSPPPPLVDPSEVLLSSRVLTLAWRSSPSSQKRASVISFSGAGGLAFETIRRASRTYSGYDFPIRWISAATLTPEFVTSFFQEIVLTPEEDLVVEALRIIEPTIERVAPTRSGQGTNGSAYSPRAEFFVRLKDVKDRIPIGSMGDGIWRMLGLALHVVHSRDGILLIDDVDTGLHHTVLEDLWRFLDAAARRYHIQIFATTHSRDCYESLAAICDEAESEAGDVTIQRIERGRDKAVAYSEPLIIAAARHDVEVR